MTKLFQTIVIGMVLAVAGVAAGAGHVNVATLAGSINPVSANYLITSIETSESDGAVALLIELDTPGGLVSSTKDIIQAMLNAEVPVIVYVAPRGAWAASAGTFITMAGHVAVMAPGTNIGAAHPVGVGSGQAPAEEGEEGEAPRDYAMEKAENLIASMIETIAKERGRNAEWAVDAVRNSVAIDQEEALEKGVIDLVSGSRTALLDEVDGREVTVLGEKVTLETGDARVVELEMPLVSRFLHVLASPDVAILLFMGGLILIYWEINNPGLIIPGVTGVAFLLMAAIAFQALPFSWLGLIIMLVGIGLFVAELFVTSYGILFAAGVGCLLLGGSMIFDMPESSDLNVSFFEVLLPAVGGMSLFAALIIWVVARSMSLPEITGSGELVGLRGEARTALGPDGMVFVRGEIWKAHADGPIESGEPIEVTDVDGLELRVRRAPPRT